MRTWPPSPSCSPCAASSTSAPSAPRGTSATPARQAARAWRLTSATWTGWAAVRSLAELERKPIPDDLRRRVAVVRNDLAGDLWSNRLSWRSWNWRDARRLQRLEAMGVHIDATDADPPHNCDGSLIPQAAP